jgi:hypothetical protein
MLAAAEVAVERVDQLFVIKHILATSKSYLDKLKDKNNRNMAELYHAMIWEVYQTLANRGKCSLLLRSDRVPEISRVFVGL